MLLSLYLLSTFFFFIPGITLDRVIIIGFQEQLEILS